MALMLAEGRGQRLSSRWHWGLASGLATQSVQRESLDEFRYEQILQRLNRRPKKLLFLPQTENHEDEIENVSGA